MAKDKAYIKADDEDWIRTVRGVDPRDVDDFSKALNKYFQLGDERKNKERAEEEKRLESMQNSNTTSYSNNSSEKTEEENKK